MKSTMSGIYVLLLLSILFGQFKGKVETIDFDRIYESWEELNTTQLEADAITKKETALAIGKALLEEHFSWKLKEDWNESLEATEKDGIWVVYNVFGEPQIMEDGSYLIIKDGGVRVYFRKSDGKVLRFEMDG